MAKDGLKKFLTKTYEKTGAVNILEEIEYLDTGIPSLNYVISGRPLTGGIPLSGKMTTIYGPEGSGKTSLINHIIATAQKKDVDVVYIDTERSITIPRLKQFGVDIDSLIYATPEYIEEVFAIIDDVCSYRLSQKDHKKTLIIWDSVAGTPAKQTLERDADAVEMAADARSLTRGLKRVRGKVKNSNAGVIYINQARVNMDPHGDKFIMPGGYALKHMVDLVVRVNKIKAKGRVDGQIIRFSTPDKNRMFRPFQSSDVFFDFDKCFTRESIITGFVDFLVNVGIIGTSGAWCYNLTDVLDLMEKEGISESEAIKNVKKFYRSKYVEELIENEEEYQRLLGESEKYIQRNLNSVAEKGRDKEFEGKSEEDAEKAAKKFEQEAEEFENDEVEFEED